MAKKGKNHKDNNKKDKKKDYLLTLKTKRWIKAILMFLFAVVLGLSFLERAGIAGQFINRIIKVLVGDSKITTATIIFSLLFSGFVFLKSHKKIKFLAILLAVVTLVVGMSGISANQNLNQNQMGAIGFLAQNLAKFFGLLVANIIFGAIMLISAVIFLELIWQAYPKDEKKSVAELAAKTSDAPTFKISGVESENLKTSPPKISLFKKGDVFRNQKPAVVPIFAKFSKGKYSLPPIDLLSKDETVPTPGNIKENSLIMKKTLENFGIPVEMTEVNIGPSVTQYAFKPAEGVKLSKITTLSNNLALALAAHPIRIEAPIPGKSLVGVEVPNKVRATVVLRNLISHQGYQNGRDVLPVALGRDVSGAPAYTDLVEMPHMLVAGATGTGKTIFLNSLILSLLYKHTPETLRLIMVDPKRVEFQNYNTLPHLLCPVIYDAPKTMNALQWLTKEMERRFEVFSEIPTRNIRTYNQDKSVVNSNSQLPYIVLMIDELADLMAAKGRELETGIVRLAQMARATGIHLVLATQRPSVEVITGLIKANITSRITFQVASQVDSRTVLDSAGAEKLLGSGDMLFLSSKSSKVTRIQGPYIPEKEVKKVTDWIAEHAKLIKEPHHALLQSLQETLTQDKIDEKLGEVFFSEDDPLFEDVKRIVLETQKASASFLQRRLRIGYSRAARLIDMLEEKGIVGPADGAKPREVYGSTPEAKLADTKNEELENSNNSGNYEEWQKV